jgi:hypothetical protein
LVECGQLFCDILHEPLIQLDWGGEVLSALGAVLGLGRDIDFLTDAGPVRLDGFVVEPGERALYYDKHYAVHCQLIQRWSCGLCV